MKRVKDFIQSETVLAAALFAALLSMLWVPPSKEYLAYFDLRVLALLFCLMAVMAALQKVGFLQRIARVILERTKTIRSLGRVLVLLCFFSSMFITNDVALLTFVPLAIWILHGTEQDRAFIYVVVLQTIAANLGSMLTPVGNPQNLFLYSHFQMPDAAFFAATVPITAVGFLLLLAGCLLLPQKSVSVTFKRKAAPFSFRRLAVPFVLLAICLLAVLRVLPYQAALFCVIAGIFFWDRKVFAGVDYALLATFVCFFVFVGNLGRIDAIHTLLEQLLAGRELLVSALVSQVISNVPASVLLSGFTENARALLLGTNIGGVGTLVASLASLISYKLYAKLPGAKIGRYLLVFTVLNIGVFAFLLGVSYLIL